MSFNRGDKVTVYRDDLLQRERNATVVYYAGEVNKRSQWMVEFANKARSVVSEEWLEKHSPPMMEDAKAYLEALNDLSLK